MCAEEAWQAEAWGVCRGGLLQLPEEGVLHTSPCPPLPVHPQHPASSEHTWQGGSLFI